MFGLSPIYEFSTSSFGGFVRPAGHYHGLVLTHDAHERVITRPGRCFMNLEHFTAAGRGGLFVPRDGCEHRHTVGRDWVEIRFSPTAVWHLSTVVRYSLLAADTVDVSWRFEFNADYLGFEAFIASYMPVGTVPPLIRSGGRWGRPHVNSVPKEQLFVARDEEAKRLPDDGRWRELFERGFAYAVDKGAYDIPVMVTTFGEGLIDPVVIQMVNRRECPALSPNVFAPAHDFSLVGRDVRRGQEVSARARIVYRPIADLADVQALYEQFEDEDP